MGANVIAGKGQIQFGSAGAFGSYPKGCFVYSNKLYFNKGKTGKANSKANPVCVAKATGGKKTTPKKKPKKTTPKKKPASKFAMAGNGKANCGKLKPVATEKACRASAKVIKKQFGSAGAFGSYPKGCFVYNNKLYFNNGKTGKANSKSNPVCVAKATGGKKTTPKKKPVCKCPKNMAPVCGKNGRTYGNACMAKCAKTAVVSKGKCKKCPKVMIKCKCGQTYTMVKGCKVPKCKTTCDKKTTPKKKKPAPKFAMAGDGKANCGKLEAVATEKACRASAKVIKKAFGSAGAFGSYPKGCFVYNNKLYFNNGKTAKGNSKSNP